MYVCPSVASGRKVPRQLYHNKSHNNKYGIDIRSFSPQTICYIVISAHDPIQFCPPNKLLNTCDITRTHRVQDRLQNFQDSFTWREREILAKETSIQRRYRKRGKVSSTPHARLFYASGYKNYLRKIVPISLRSCFFIGPYFLVINYDPLRLCVSVGLRVHAPPFSSLSVSNCLPVTINFEFFFEETDSIIRRRFWRVVTSKSSQGSKC